MCPLSSQTRPKSPPCHLATLWRLSDLGIKLEVRSVPVQVQPRSQPPNTRLTDSLFSLLPHLRFKPPLPGCNRTCLTCFLSFAAVFLWWGVAFMTGLIDIFTNYAILPSARKRQKSGKENRKKPEFIFLSFFQGLYFAEPNKRRCKYSRITTKMHVSHLLRFQLANCTRSHTKSCIFSQFSHTNWHPFGASTLTLLSA